MKSIVKVSSSHQRMQLIHRDINISVQSLRSEGYRKVGEVRLNRPDAYLFINLYHPANGNRISLKVSESSIIFLKNRKEIKEISYEY